MGYLGKVFALTGMTVAIAACGGGGSTSSSVDPTARITAYGTIVGNDDSAANGTYSWKGIPFAKPPVGALRWKAPVAPDAWSTPLATKSFGNACLQNGRIYGPGANNRYDTTIASTLNTPVGSEDCLTLNVWRPANDTGNLPVIFFVYGGSNISGYSADPVYDGAALAKATNSVVVTTNYRVGPLGFFNLPQLKSGTNQAEDSGNFALLDIIQGLKFVKQNITNFGGNSGNVTLMGQSAGAINTWALMTSPLATGLFHKAVPISGGISLASNLPAGMLPTLNPATTYLGQGNGLLAKLLIADGKATDTASATAYIATQTSAQIADYMRSKSGSTILTTLLLNGLTGSGPIPDGYVIPTDPISAIAAGNYNKVPVLAGNTADEGKLFAPFLTLLGGKAGMIVGDAARFNMMYSFNPDAATTLTTGDILDPSYIPVTTPVSGYNAMTQKLASVFTSASRDNVLNTLVTQQPDKVWFYSFNWAQEPYPWNEIYGAAHAFDLPFIFGNFGPSLFSNATNSTANKAGRLALSNAMMSSIGAFAANGNPNNTALGTTWAQWPKRLNFDASLTQTSISTQ